MQYRNRILQRILFMSVAIIMLLASLQNSSYAVGRSKIYWTQWQKISRANLDGTNVEDVITGRFLPEDITIDTQNGRIFWIETNEAKFKNVKVGTGTIHRADPNGSNIIEIATGYKIPLEGGSAGLDCLHGVCKGYIKPEGQAKIDLEPEQLFNPSAIAVDTQKNKLYWIDDFHDKFQRANLDGSRVEDIHKMRGIFRYNIELDLKRSKLYWLSGRSIKRMDFDGNQIEDVILRWNIPILSFGLDVNAKHIYWTSSSRGIIHRSNFDGDDIREIVTGLKEPYHIVVDAESQKLYWASWDRATSLYKIQQSTLDGEDVTDIVTDLKRIYGLALDTAGIYDVSPKDRLTTIWGSIKDE